MIPILYGPQEKNFTSNGLGRLTDATECIVTEERNGRYELEFKYPIDGVHFDDLVEGNIVSCTHDEQGDRQPFVIYQHTAPDLNGVVTFYAHHISYNLANVILRPFSATSAASALAKFETEAMTEQPFSFWTDKASAGSFEITVPSPAKTMLGGTQGSILDAFGGGEYQWDNYLVKLYQNRGTNSGVTIRYGKNLMALQHTYDTLGLYNAVIPYWVGQDDEVVYGGIVTGSGGIGQSNYWTDENLVRITNENNVDFTFDFTISQTTTMDLSDEFDDEPTTAELEARALQIMNSNEPWAPKENIKVDFVALWQTEEYANVAPLERVRLCDTVTVYYPALNVNATAKVITTKYDVLSDRYSSIELGAAKTSFAQVLTAETEEKLAEVPSKSMMQEAIDHATALITGGLGGHVVFRYDASGKPTEILVMDTDDENTAVHVLRINVNGIGFSSTGVSGQYNTAWTLDGSFVADFITAGYLSANRIHGGTLLLGGVNNGNGVMEVYDAAGNEIGHWNMNGMNVSGSFMFQNELQAFSAGKFPTTYYYHYGNATNIETRNMAGTDFWTYDNGGDLIASESWATLTTSDLTSHASVTTQKIYTNLIATSATSMPGDFGDNSFSCYINGESFCEGVWRRQIRAYHMSGVSAGYYECISHATGIYLSTTGDRTNSNTHSPAGSASNPIVAHVGLDTDGITICGGARQINVEDDEFSIYSTYSSGSSTTPLIIGRSDMLYFGSGWLSSYLYLRIESNLQQINGKNIQFSGSSSKRYKHDITTDISEELDPHKLYDLEMVQFVFNKDHTLQYPDMAGQTLPGFIAEDVAEVYPAAVIHDHEGKIENWDERRIIPGILKLIQEQKQEIDELKERLARLEHVVEALTNDMR